MRTDCIKHLNKLIPSIQAAVNSGLIDLKDLDDDFADLVAYRAIFRDSDTDSRPICRKDFDSAYVINPNIIEDRDDIRTYFSCSLFKTKESLEENKGLQRKAKKLKQVLKPSKGIITKSTGLIYTEDTAMHIDWYLFEETVPEQMFDYV